jgi:hypothetical protein
MAVRRTSGCTQRLDPPASGGLCFPLDVSDPFRSSLRQRADSVPVVDSQIYI